VYDASGKMLAEYSTIVESPSTAKVSYLTTDHLGSPRILTDANGNVISRRDFHPFGEEIVTTQRTQGLGYTADSVRQKFTSYERDIESNLDFAQARMYNFQHGRFTAVDPLLVSADPANPQSWNRYIYCFNNPLIFIDPSGEITGDYYDKEGRWLFTDNINDDKVYLATPTTTADGATNYEVQELAITHTQFKIISNIVKQEGATDDTNEYLWIAHASNNRASATNRSLYGLLMTGYSAVSNKTGLSTRDDSLRANAARAGVIDVLTGGADPTNGAQFWDGTDFLAWGESQRKFKEYGSIIIREDIFNNYLSSQGGSSVRYGGRLYVLPADVFNRNKNPNNWGNWNRDGVPEFGFKYIKNRDRGILYATGTAGKSIFWTINYTWVK
jgi:RHS repeat-associated protein